MLLTNHSRVGSAEMAVNASLSGRTPDVLGTWAFWSLTNVELDAVTLTQILEPLSIHRTAVEKVFVSSIALDEPKPLLDS